MKKKKLIVCDYPNPNNYTFPNFGLGSTEKRFWQIAETISNFKDFEVIITGPLWIPKYVKGAKYFPKRLDKSTVNEFVRKFGKADYLFAGSEYFDKDDYSKAFLKAANKIISYVTHVYDFKKVSFDGRRSFLFCYSDEMFERYKKQKPHKLLLFHSGVNEKPYLTIRPKRYLIWAGRIDFDKCPHYAILAAKKLDIPIYILGDTVMQPDYKIKYEHLLKSAGVKYLGVVSGRRKMKILSEALLGVYTCGPNFKEAGAAILGEMMCSGLPIAGMTWSGNDAVCEAVNSDKLGKVLKAKRSMSENDIVNGLAKTIKECLTLDRKTIFEIGSYRFNMDRLMREMFFIVENGA